MSIQIDEVLDWRGRAVVDRTGQKIGTFDEIYLDEGTNEPAWAAVKTGPLRLRRRVVPIDAVHADGDEIRVPFTKDQVKSAPTIDSEGWVGERDQDAIFRHYGLTGQARQAGSGGPPEATAHEAHPHQSPVGPESDGGNPSDAGADNEEPARVRLKRYSVTETVTRRSEFGPE
jgi:PRC-barrel domain